MRIRIDVVVNVRSGLQHTISFYPEIEREGDTLSEEQVAVRVRRSFFREAPFTFQQVALEDGVL